MYETIKYKGIKLKFKDLTMPSCLQCFYKLSVILIYGNHAPNLHKLSYRKSFLEEKKRSINLL